MGGAQGISVTEEQREANRKLYDDCVEAYNENATPAPETKPTTLSGEDDKLFQIVTRRHLIWRSALRLRKIATRTPLIELENTLERAFTSRTPFIIDNSADDQVCTFYSYQPDCLILDGRLLIAESLRKTKEEVWEIARRCLVNAMKHGKLLLIRLGHTAPDFLQNFTDDAFFPLEVLLHAGACMKNDDTYLDQVYRPDDSFPHKNVKLCREEFRVAVTTQLDFEAVEEFLFMSKCLPDKKHFAFVKIEGD